MKTYAIAMKRLAKPTSLTLAPMKKAMPHAANVVVSRFSRNMKNEITSALKPVEETDVSMVTIVQV